MFGAIAWNFCLILTKYGCPKMSSSATSLQFISFFFYLFFIYLFFYQLYLTVVHLGSSSKTKTNHKESEREVTYARKRCTFTKLFRIYWYDILTRVYSSFEEPDPNIHKHIHAIKFWFNANQNRFISNLYGLFKIWRHATRMFT